LVLVEEVKESDFFMLYFQPLINSLFLLFLMEWKGRKVPKICKKFLKNGVSTPKIHDFSNVCGNRMP